MTPGPDLREGCAEILSSWGLDLGTLLPLAGDASTRRYLRARYHHGATAVVMDCGGPLPEVSAGRDGFAFTRWQMFYVGLGIRVPAVRDISRETGLVLLEDLGDELLQARVETRGPAECRDLYLRAVHWGRKLAEDGAPRYDPSQDPDEDPLVPARLALETDLFLVHASRLPLPEATSALPPLRRAARALDETGEPALRHARALLHRLCEDVHAAGPMAPCHRDYHARNLVVCADDLAVIDFQDTRRGPRAYDLASLAFDPYVTLPGAMIDELCEAWRPEHVAPDAWEREVRLCAGQRLIKAAGSYAWLSGERGKPMYSQWLTPALGRARERLARWDGRDALWDDLARLGIA